MTTADRRHGRLLATVLALCLALVPALACSSDGGTSTAATSAPEVARLRVEVRAAKPHDPRAYTQGLVLDDASGVFFESTGLQGRSSLRRVTAMTGAVVQNVGLPPAEFGEGLAQVEDRLVQLTWKDGIAHVYEATTFEEVGTFTYEGEGWGLCYDGERLVMSDGSDELTFRDPETFAELGSVRVTLDGDGVNELNELECVDGTVYANVYKTDQIVQIDPSTGDVIADIDAAGLLTEAEAFGVDVLNGIAWSPSRGTFFLTGKLWPTMFEVTFVPA